MKLSQTFIKIKKIKDKNLFIFDFDGVIVDSMHLKGEVFSNIFEEYNHSMHKKIIDFHLTNGSVTRHKKIDYIINNILQLNINKSQKQKLILKKIIEFEEKYTFLSRKIKTIKGLNIFLKKIYFANKKLYIVSAAPFKEIKEICKSNSIYSYFSKIYDNKYDKSQAILKIINENKFLKKDIIYFGDSISDYNISKKIEIDFCSVITNTKAGLQKLKDIKFKIYDFKI